MASLLAMGFDFILRIIHRTFATHKAVQFAKHQVMKKQILQERNLLIVGDVHGCYDEFIELYKTAQLKSKKELTVIMIGDMINKGPKNIEMLNFLLENKNFHCIRGNHEQWVIDELKMKDIDRKILPLWISELSESHKDFLHHLPLSLSLPNLGILAVHAGLVPGVPLEAQCENDLMNIRCVKWQADDFHGQVLRGTSEWDGIPWVKCYSGPPHVYFGHDAISKLQLHKHCTGLDTGCLYGGVLTAVLLHLPDKIDDFLDHNYIEKEFFTVTPKKVYKPV